MHPYIQTKKRIHRYFLLIFFFSRLSSWSKLLADLCYSIFLSWPTTHFFLPVWGRERPQPSMKRHKIIWEAFLQNIHPVFRFLTARSLDMTCPLTSDRHFSSPRFCPCSLKKGCWIKRASQNIRDLVRNAGSASLEHVKLRQALWGHFTKIMIFVDCLTLSLCVRQCSKTLPKFDNFEVFMSDLAD